MAQIASLSLADGQTTPVTHVFIPQAPQQGKTPSQWIEKGDGPAVGFNRVTLLVDFKASGPSKVRVVIAAPSIAILGANCCVDLSTPQVTYTEFFDGTFTLPFQATSQNRKDILAFAKNMLGSSVMTAAVVNLEPAY